MLNLIQHLKKLGSYETLKQVQGDKLGLFYENISLVSVSAVAGKSKGPTNSDKMPVGIFIEGKWNEKKSGDTYYGSFSAVITGTVSRVDENRPLFPSKDGSLTGHAKYKQV